MKSANLPVEKASEPKEQARQPKKDTIMPPSVNVDQIMPSKKLTFAKDVDFAENHSSQRSSSYKEVLSQPPCELSHGQKLLWLQKRRSVGLWVQCDDCDKWRYMPHILDKHELPDKWYCRLNADKKFANCSAPEDPLRLHDEEDLIHSEYSAGSLVWARLTGWPWWPAMVDDCPDTEQYYWLDGFSDIPTHYNVVFFDNMDATRAWISPENLKPYASNKRTFRHLVKNKKFTYRINAAMSQADEAETMEIITRLEKFSFIARHKGRIQSPKKINKKDLTKFKKRFKNKFNVDFPMESSDSDDDNQVAAEKPAEEFNNLIISDTPQRQKCKSRPAPGVRVETSTVAIPSNTKESMEETQTTKDDEGNTDKPSNSMMVQVGSTEMDFIDNDSSKTFA